MTPRTLLFLHGAGQNPPTWQDVVTDVGPDRPLHAPWLRGLKPTDGRGFDIDGAVADLVSLMELRDLTRRALTVVSCLTDTWRNLRETALRSSTDTSSPTLPVSVNLIALESRLIRICRR